MPLIAFLLLLFILPAKAGEPFRARLVAGTMEGSQLWAGIEIRLAPGYKTYWRNPGDSGLAPAFDWSKSDNVKSISVLWPAPIRFEEGNGASYGYEEHVVLPLKVTPEQQGDRIRLRAAMELGICKDLCIPMRANLALDLPAPPSPLVAQALAKVPERQGLGAQGSLSIEKVRWFDGRVIVEARVPEGSRPELFAEGEQGWMFSASEVQDLKGTQAHFTLVPTSKPSSTSLVPLTLTLTASGQAIETGLTLPRP